MCLFPETFQRLISPSQSLPDLPSKLLWLEKKVQPTSPVKTDGQRALLLESRRKDLGIHHRQVWRTETEQIWTLSLETETVLSLPGPALRCRGPGPHTREALSP